MQKWCREVKSNLYQTSTRLLFAGIDPYDILIERETTNIIVQVTLTQLNNTAMEL